MNFFTPAKKISVNSYSQIKYFIENANKNGASLFGVFAFLSVWGFAVHKFLEEYFQINSFFYQLTVAIVMPMIIFMCWMRFARITKNASIKLESIEKEKCELEIVIENYKKYKTQDIDQKAADVKKIITTLSTLPEEQLLLVVQFLKREGYITE